MMIFIWSSVTWLITFCGSCHIFWTSRIPVSAVADEPARRAASRQTAKFNKSSAAAEMVDRLATVGMGRNVGAAVSLSVGVSWVLI